MADVGVEQPPVSKAGGKSVVETTKEVASREIVFPSEKQKDLDKVLDRMRSKSSSPTNGEGDTEKGGDETVTLTTFTSGRESQEDSPNERESGDGEVTTQVDEVTSEQEGIVPAQEADGDKQ